MANQYTSTNSDRVLTYLVESGPATVPELSRELGVKRASMHETCRRLVKRERIYLLTYRRNTGTSGDFSPVFAFGKRPEGTYTPRKPKALTQKQRSASYYQRLLLKFRLKSVVQRAKKKQSKPDIAKHWFYSLRGSQND